MADSVNVFPPSLRVTDADGNPVAGAKLKFFEAGTSTPLPVYSDDALTAALGTVVYCDSAGYPVTTEGGSTKTLIYAGTTDYKLTITDADDVTIAEHDDNPGALDTSGFTVTSAAPSMPVLTRATSSWSVASDAPGTLYRCNVAGSSQTVSFPSAVTAGDGYLFGLQYEGPASSNSVTYQGVGGQTIADGADAEAASGVLTEHGQTKWFLSDGAGWRVVFAKQGRLDRGLLIVIADRLTAPPTSPSAGARYIINGTPSGTWAALGFAEHDIVEANGQGGWIQYNPEGDCGWVAYVQDENINYQYQDSAWVAWANIETPATSYLGYFLAQYEAANGTLPDALVTGSWQDIASVSAASWTEKADTFTDGVSIAADGTVTLPATKMMATVTVSFAGFVGVSKLRWVDSGGTTLATSYQVTDDRPLVCTAHVDFSGGSDTIKPQAWIVNSGYPGVLHADTAVEVYGQISILDLQAQQGAQGAAGSQGATGRDAGHARYTFSTNTTDSDPGSGAIKFDSGTLGSITTLFVNATDADSVDLDDFWSAVDGSSSTVKGQLVLRKANAPSTFLVLDIDGATTDNTDWWDVPVSYVDGVLPSNADSLLLTFVRSGDIGSSGANGSDGGIPYTFSSSTDTAAAPGAGLWRANNASLASATQLAIDDESAASGNPDLSDYLATWDDGTSTQKGTLIVTKASAAENFVIYSVTGLTDQTGFVQLAVTHIDSAGTISNTDSTRLIYIPTGDKGDTGITTDLANDVNGNSYSIYGVTNTYNDQTGTTYTLQATDTGNVLTFDNAADVTVTVPATLPVGFSCTVIQLGAGQVIFTGGAAINHVQGHDRTFGQYAMAILAVYANSGGSAAVACLSGATDN